MYQVVLKGRAEWLLRSAASGFHKTVVLHCSSLQFMSETEPKKSRKKIQKGQNQAATSGVETLAKVQKNMSFANMFCGIHEGNLILKNPYRKPHVKQNLELVYNFWPQALALRLYFSTYNHYMATKDVFHFIHIHMVYEGHDWCVIGHIQGLSQLTVNCAYCGCYSAPHSLNSFLENSE